MNFESPITPKTNLETLQKTTLDQLYTQHDPEKIKLLAKALGVRTFLQKTSVQELVATSIKAMNEDQLKDFLEANSELLSASEEEDRGGE